MKSLALIAISWCVLATPTSHGFCLLPSGVETLRTARRSPFLTGTTPRMCICIDCAFVTNCTSYHFVETKHGQPHLTPEPTFTPVDGSPTIHVNIRTQRANQHEIKRLWSEHAAEAAKAEARRENGSEYPVENTVYDMSSVTTYEYDVVKCASFVEDKGRWIRNMPEEIRQANPDFVPT